MDNRKAHIIQKKKNKIVFYRQTIEKYFGNSSQYTDKEIVTLFTSNDGLCTLQDVIEHCLDIQNMVMKANKDFNGQLHLFKD